VKENWVPAQASSAKLLFQNLVFDLQIHDDFLLMPVDPAGEDEEPQLPRL
jgi:hypothetical protein